MLDKIKKGLWNLWDYFWNKHFLFSIYLLLSFFLFLLFPQSLSLMLTWALVTITIAYAISTEKSAEIAKKTMIHQALLDIHKVYRSHEMGYAVHSLWEFFRDECNEDEDILKSMYEDRLKEDMNKIKNEEDKIKFKGTTLDSQRRIVSHFYRHLFDLKENEMLTEEEIFKFWDWNDLKIIPYIIIPLDEKLAEIIKSKEKRKYEPEPVEKTDKLIELYNSSVDYFNKNLNG